MGPTIAMMGFKTGVSFCTGCGIASFNSGSRERYVAVGKTVALNTLVSVIARAAFKTLAVCLSITPSPFTLLAVSTVVFFAAPKITAKIIEADIVRAHRPIYTGLLVTSAFADKMAQILLCVLR